LESAMASSRESQEDADGTGLVSSHQLTQLFTNRRLGCSPNEPKHQQC